MKRFALTGAAGYVAPRHFAAIRDTGNCLVAAIDPFDSVGILDSFFPDCAFFTEYERFDRHLEKLRRESPEKRVDIISICSPNHLHDAHIRTALRLGADALCEKPVVLNPWNVDALMELEEETGHRVWTVLQLRVHPAVVALRGKLAAGVSRKKHKLVLTYVTSRGNWYLRSWKGVLERSGGLATNIGVHFFDMLIWLFGQVQTLQVDVSDERTCAGWLELETAEVKWFLSIDSQFLPAEQLAEGSRTYRSLTIDGEEIDFSGGFADLHTEVYRRTMAGAGFGLSDTRAAIETVQRIRTMHPSGPQSNSHPFLR